MLDSNTDQPDRFQPGDDPWTVRLWDLEVIKGLRQPGDQRLTLHSALIVLLGGDIRMERDQQTLRMSKGSACFCPKNSTFGMSAESPASVNAMIFYFSVYQANQADEELRHELRETDANREGGVAESVIQFPGWEDRAALICRSIYDHFYHKGKLKRWKAQLDFQELLYGIITASVHPVGTDKTQALERARSHMEEHYADELTMDQLAGIAELSPKYFAEVFRKAYGLSAMEYLTQIRLNKAKQLILGTGGRLRDVAHQVGYKDEFYFSRRFKKEFGLSPTAYSRSKQNKLAVYGSSSVLGFLIPLEITPYAAPLHPKWSPSYYHALASVVPVHLDAYRQNYNKRMNLQKLADSRPELIICASSVETWEKEGLEKIAPVYEMKAETIGWESQLGELADLLDKKKEAQNWLDGFHARETEVRHELRDRLKEPPRILPLCLHLDELRINEGRGFREVLFELMGAEDAFPGAGPIRLEELAGLRAEHLFLLVRQDTATLAYWAKLQSSPQWLGIEAVRSGKVHLLSSYPWREYSPEAIRRMLGELPVFFSDKSP